MITTVHAKEYGSYADLQKRYDELAALNTQLGESDGRVTEQNALKAGMRQRMREMQAARRRGDAAAQDARQRFSHLDKGRGYERSIHYIDHDGGSNTRYFSTEFGFEVGYARLIAQGLLVVAAG